MARLFVCGDTGQTGLLDDVAGQLKTLGHTVVRGPVDVPGTVRTYDARERAALIDDADVAVFTVRHSCSRELMAGLKRLHGVCYPTIGVETLDLAAADELGIIVGHGAVLGNIVGMAESTVMLMLMLLYDVETNIALVKAGRWRRPGHHARQLQGKTVGLIGFGRIAREVAARLAPFGVRLVTYSPRVRPESLPAGVAKVDLDTLLADSDVVSILAGLTPETRQMIGRKELAQMRPTAFLVNTGRGAVIDEAALIETLTARRISGAALDTFAVEPLAADHPLRALDNVILTPHCVGHTVEGYAEFAPALVENVVRILRAELPLYCRNPGAEPAWRERLRRLAVSPIEGEAA